MSTPAGGSLGSPLTSSPADLSPRMTWNQRVSDWGATGDLLSTAQGVSDDWGPGNRGLGSWEEPHSGSERPWVQSQLCGPQPPTLSPSKDGVLRSLRGCQGKPSVYTQACVISFMSWLKQTLNTLGEHSAECVLCWAELRPRQGTEKRALWPGCGGGTLLDGWGRSGP